MSTISNSANRVSGLISGLDTEELVKAMTAKTKMRINSQKQKLQTLQWKQESYRGVISKISDFKNKYLDILSSSSIKANAVMKKTIATSSSTKIAATASAGATAAKYTIKEATAAKAAVFSSDPNGGAVSTGEINLDFSKNIRGKSYTVEVTLDGSTKNISFIAGNTAEESQENFLKSLNSVFSEYNGSTGNQFEFSGGTSKSGRVTLAYNNNNDGILHTFSVGYNSEGVGLSSTASSKIQTSSTLGSVAFKQALQTTDDGKYKFNINGVDFEFSKDTKISDVISTVNKSSAGVKLSFNNVSQTFSLETTQTGAAAEINLYQTEGNLLNSLFNLDSSQLSATNASIAKNVLDYNRNMPTGTLIYSSGQSKLADGFESGDDDVTLKFTIDGEAVSIDLSSVLPKKSDDTTYTDDEIASKLTEALKDACGAQGITLDEDFSIKYYTPSGSDSSVKFLVVDTNAHAVQLEKTSGIGMADEINTNTPVAANESTIFRGVNTLQFENEDGELVSITDMGDGISVKQLIDAGIVKMPSDGTMIAAGNFTTTDETTKKFIKDYFGIEADESGVSTLIGAKSSEVQTVRGSNSTLVISGDDGKSFTTYSSASNQFTFDGTTITLGSIDGFKAETDEDYITVETAKDTSGIKDVIMSFVNDYNQLLEDLYKETSTTRPKSSGSYYDPLTEEQEEEMSDKEIEKWNENAKTGLLFRDSNVQKFLSDIRSAMVTRVNGFGLSDMGITLTSSWTENGKLEINESKLEAAIEAHGDEIAEFFTSENGLAAKLEKTVDKAISTKSKNYGYLSALAGVEGTTSAKNNQIYKQIEFIQDLIERLNTKYENEQERYWKKYTALESYMAQAQTQMSYFTDGSY